RVLRCYGLAAESLCGLTRSAEQPAPAPALHAVPRAVIPDGDGLGDDGGARRATVPSWEDIMFGVRRPEL
ncbi:MAG: hypothetical protein QOC60_1983, partial [Frankiaceae bacterium]|nr:hypothetical protein [Frankiaceae bacterium]